MPSRRNAQAPRLLEARYLDVDGVAAYLSKTRKAVQCLVAKSHIPFIRLGRSVRFDRVEIDKWMARHANRGKPL